MDLNRDHELQVTVRGAQVEVALNGEVVLTYALPNPRPAQGRFQIWTYDATAEFRGLEITNGAVLSEAGLMAAAQQAESAAKLTEKKMTVASATLDLARAAHRG